jgi:hypothetical protein
MNYLKKNFPIFLLSGSLIFAGISLSPSAQGATATISSLQKEILTLKKQILTLKKDMQEVKECIDLNIIVQSAQIFRLWNEKNPYEYDDEPAYSCSSNGVALK